MSKGLRLLSNFFAAGVTLLGEARTLMHGDGASLEHQVTPWPIPLSALRSDYYSERELEEHNKALHR